MYCIFVCTGNTCRSPMAAGYFNWKCASHYHKQKCYADSAGTHAIDGMPAASHAVTVLKEIDIDISSHRSKLLDKYMTVSADYILTMTAEHQSFISEYFPEFKDKVYLITAFMKKDGNFSDIPDPVGGTLEEYRHCFTLIKESIDAFFLEKF